MAGLLLPIAYEDLIKKQKIDKINLFSPKILFIAALIVWNIYPKFNNIEPQFDGNVRYLKLSMLDAKLVCNYKFYEVSENGEIKSLTLPRIARAVRVKCDPLTYETLFRNICRNNPNKKFMFHLESRNSTSLKFKTIRKYRDVCNEV